MSTKKPFKLGLVPKLLIGLALGLVIGLVVPEVVIRVLVTFSGAFSTYLGFIIPLMIVSFVTAGIAHLSAGGAGRILGATVMIAYLSTWVAGTLAYTIDSTIFPSFITSDLIDNFHQSDVSIEPFFSIPLEPVFTVTSAIILAFVLGIGSVGLKLSGKEELNELMVKIFDGLEGIIVFILNKSIIPVLPFYIAAVFAKLSFTGEVWSVMSVFWKVYVIVIFLHFAYLFALFMLAGGVSKKNPFALMKNQIPAWLTAVGTQSSAATIPVNVGVAAKNGVSKSIREFTVPLFATIHLAGSTITIISCSTAVLLMNDMPHGLSTFVPFIMTLGVIMIAAPGAPGGAIMSALPFLAMIGIPAESELATLMIALYLTQDSFGTACNVSGDNALAVFIDTFKEKIAGHKFDEEEA